MNIASLVEVKKNPKIPDISPGDTVRVSVRIVEGGKERIQVFQGVVLKIKRGGTGASFTVRHVAFGIGVERTFPFYSSLVEKVEIVRQGKVRRSRLFYLRGLSGKEARRKIKRVERKVKQVGEELLQSPPEEEIEEAMAAEAVEEKPAEAAVPAEARVEEAPAKAEAPAETAAAPEAEVKEPAVETIEPPAAEAEESPALAEAAAAPEPPAEEEKKETA
jgi:large subunit ribosomal protein L19